MHLLAQDYPFGDIFGAKVRGTIGECPRRGYNIFRYPKGCEILKW